MTSVHYSIVICDENWMWTFASSGVQAYTSVVLSVVLQFPSSSIRPAVTFYSQVLLLAPALLFLCLFTVSNNTAITVFHLGLTASYLAWRHLSICMSSSSSNSSCSNSSSTSSSSSSSRSKIVYWLMLIKTMTCTNKTHYFIVLFVWLCNDLLSVISFVSLSVFGINSVSVL